MGGAGYTPCARESDGVARPPSRRYLLVLPAKLTTRWASLSQ
jgi:hypothetical protein